MIGIEELRSYSVSRSLFSPASLEQALRLLGFVQADPIRAPARAQDLTLRHRVAGYRAGDLERQYPRLEVEEDVFITYGYVHRPVQSLMHPRRVPGPIPAGGRRRADRVLAFVRERGEVHPREVDRHFAPGTVRNYWGGSSSATTHLMEHLHYRGLLRVSRREKGIRIYALRDSVGAADPVPDVERLDRLVDVAVNLYAPLPAASLSNLISRLRWGVPQWHRALRASVHRAKQRLASTVVDGNAWYWPPHERPDVSAVEERVRLLAPFDPLVWDRRRFALLWGWEYRFEAYTPVRQRKLGYYALPLLWRDRVIGWANVSRKDGSLVAEPGFVSGRPRARAFRHAFEAEMELMRSFLDRDSEAGAETVNSR